MSVVSIFALFIYYEGEVRKKKLRYHARCSCISLIASLTEECNSRSISISFRGSPEQVKEQASNPLVSSPGSGLSRRFFAEVLVQLIMPWPIFNSELLIWSQASQKYLRYNLNEFMVLGMFMRMYMISFCWFLDHPFLSPTCLLLGKMGNVQYLVCYDLLFIVYLWVANIIFFSFSLYILDRSVWSPGTPAAFSQYFSFALLQMTLTKNETLQLRTDLAKAFTYLMSAVGLILLVLTINAFRNFLQPQPNDEQFLQSFEFDRAVQRLRKSAATLIESVYLRSPMYKSNGRIIKKTISNNPERKVTYQDLSWATGEAPVWNIFDDGDLMQRIEEFKTALGRAKKRSDEAEEDDSGSVAAVTFDKTSRECGNSQTSHAELVAFESMTSGCISAK
eukprot:71457-Hanusia_phi.AAC.1